MSTSASFAHMFWQGVSKAPDWRAVVDLSSVSPAQQKHLRQVYLSETAFLLLYGLAARASMGFDSWQLIPVVATWHLSLQVYLAEVAFLLLYGLAARANMGYPFGGVTTFLGLWGLFLPFLLLPITPQTQPLRLGLGLGMCLLKGASAGPLVRTIASVQDFRTCGEQCSHCENHWVGKCSVELLHIQTYTSVQDFSPLAAAVAASSAVFLAFTAATVLFQGRRQLLLLGGFCGSALSVPLALHLASLAFGADVMRFSVQMSIGLIVLAILTVYGTQVMISRAGSSEMDFVADSFEFWIDILAVAFHVLAGGRKQLRGGPEHTSKKTT